MCPSMRHGRTLVPLGLLTLTLAAGACAFVSRDAEREQTYLRWVAWEEPVAGEFFLAHWRKSEMPLKVHLPLPPHELFPDARAIHDAVKEGIFEWSDVASPGVPSFVLVDTPGEADIPILWARRPTGNWYIAHCAYERHSQTELRVSHIRVTGRYAADQLADLHDVYWTMLHEMGHALGLVGHSPFPGDVMYVGPDRVREQLSPRDRATLAELYRLPIGKQVVGGGRSLR